MAELVSIIIPFYNEERYLERAVRSALEQRYSPLEIILVNDGATDGSPAIARALCREQENVMLIDMPNSGPGAARNAGMEKANGAYLTFLDSDDMLGPEAISSWMQKAKAGNADIVIGKFRMKNSSNGSELVTGWKGKGQPGNGADGVRAMYEYRMASTVWAKLYRASIAKGLRFPERHWFEDRYFLLSYFLKADHIVFDENAGLDILSRRDSLTRRLLSEQKIKDAYEIYMQELELVSAHELHREFTRLIDRHQINALIETMIILYYDRSEPEYSKNLEQCLSGFIVAFTKRLKQNNTRIGLRDRMDLMLLHAHRYVGWPVVYRLLPLWKRKKCLSVLALKSF